MRHKTFLRFATLSIACLGAAVTVSAQDQTVAQQLSILDERLSKLRADVDALQFNQQQVQQDIKQLQGQLEEVRHEGPSASANDLQALEARVRALDAAREADKKAIIDQLAKELATMGGAHGATPPSVSADSTEHVVQKGETLTSIAKNCGVTIADLRKANNLASDSLKVGQKLMIPPK
jgi:LysM repeat protein